MLCERKSVRKTERAEEKKIALKYVGLGLLYVILSMWVVGRLSGRICVIITSDL